MKKVIATSIITATLLFVGCGGGSSSSSDDTTNSSLADVVATPTPIPTNVAVPDRVIGKGYYVDSAVEGVEYDCGEKHGITDENGTFEFDTDMGCEFRLGELKLRELNLMALEDNVTVLEDNITVAQLLQTLDADGDASNGIQLLDGVDEVVSETITSLEDLEDTNDTDLLEALHSALEERYGDEYNGTVVDINQTIQHLNETRAELKEENRRTQHDVIAERVEINREAHIAGNSDINATGEAYMGGTTDDNTTVGHYGDVNATMDGTADGNMTRAGVENGRGHGSMSANSDTTTTSVSDDDNELEVTSDSDVEVTSDDVEDAQESAEDTAETVSDDIDTNEVIDNIEDTEVENPLDNITAP